ncbi:MAG: AAA family ATPase [Patescibacteria group bacterium UBA2163]
MIIGVTGTDGAGKGTVVDYLVKEKGFAHYHARALLIEEIEKRSLPNDRVHMRLVANDLRAQHGNDYVVRFFLDRAEKTGDTKIAIDSLRTVAEAQTLQDAGGILLAVDADQALRYERVQARRSSSDQVSFEQFKEHEALENNDPDPHGMQKTQVITMADYVLMNNGTFKELETQIETVLKKIQERL